MNPTLLPSDLPGHCPQCGAGMTLLRNVRTRHGKWGRRMKTAARLALPVGLLLALVLAVMPKGPGIDRSLGFGMFVLIFFPTLIMESFVLLCRKVRIMRCHQCAWEQDYPFDSRPPALTS